MRIILRAWQYAGTTKRPEDISEGILKLYKTSEVVERDSLQLPSPVRSNPCGAAH
jgi:hypothetical protein